jgi:branched-chain amino acid transport system substrate-binding protein
MQGRRPLRRKAMVATAIGLALAVSACAGTGSGTASTNASAHPTAAPLPGKPIVIADISDLTGIPSFDPSPLVNGAKAAIEYINSQGGIGGRPLQLTSCDTKFDPGASVACAQAAVKDAPLVVTGIDNNAGSGGAAVIRKAGLASLRVPTQTEDLTDASIFAVGAGGPAEYFGAGDHIGRAVKAKKIAQLQTDNAYGHTFAGQLDTAAKAAGVTEDNMVYFSPTTTDFSAAAAQAASGSPDAVFTTINGSQIPLVYRLLQQQGVRADQIFNQGGAFNADVFAKAGDAVVGSYINNEFANPDDLSNPEVKLYRDVMTQYGYGDDARTMFGMWGFANAMFIAEVAKKIGPDKLDAAAFKSYLETTLVPGGSTIPVFLGTPMGPAPAQYPGIHRASIQVLQWDGQQFKTASDLFTPPQLAAGATP